MRSIEKTNLNPTSHGNIFLSAISAFISFHETLYIYFHCHITVSLYSFAETSYTILLNYPNMNTVARDHKNLTLSALLCTEHVILYSTTDSLFVYLHSTSLQKRPVTGAFDTSRVQAKKKKRTRE